MLTTQEFIERFKELVAPRNPAYFTSRDSKVTYEIMGHLHKRLVGDEEVLTEEDYVNALDHCLAADIDLTRARIINASKEVKARDIKRSQRRR